MRNHVCYYYYDPLLSFFEGSKRNHLFKNLTLMSTSEKWMGGTERMRKRVNLNLKHLNR